MFTRSYIYYEREIDRVREREWERRNDKGKERIKIRYEVKVWERRIEKKRMEERKKGKRERERWKNKEKKINE